ncbi:hypothetical protein BC936DRAFT_145900 [Jimgerdemannia flammicorona]|uniref:Uncharacterized protein n=1 Tax=Jimgerdemannia flammicorona TaxID=994334 RepID=A0A433D8V5_9FUNG|nr:hypothetical protein BC936DRAFT_145900 [Jimgerdemannia flammicorona]
MSPFATSCCARVCSVSRSRSCSSPIHLVSRAPRCLCLISLTSLTPKTRSPSPFPPRRTSRSPRNPVLPPPRSPWLGPSRKPSSEERHACVRSVLYYVPGLCLCRNKNIFYLSSLHPNGMRNGRGEDAQLSVDVPFLISVLVLT